MPAKIAALTLGLIIAFSAAPAFAANSQLSVGTDGVFLGKNLVVMQKSGSALYCRAVWGSAFMRLTVLVSTTGTTTQITKSHGGVATVDDIQQNDIIDISGRLQTGADTLLINADTVNDHSLNRENKSVSGVIKSVNGTGFVLSDKKLGTVAVNIGTTTITKGARVVTGAELQPGDTVLSAGGLYDYVAATLDARDAIVVYQNQAVFKGRNFQGTLKQIDSASLPTSLLISADGEDYRVYLPATATVMSKSKATTQLTRFTVGDTVRFYGAIRQANLVEVDATLIRDLNF